MRDSVLFRALERFDLSQGLIGALVMLAVGALAMVVTAGRRK